MTKRTSAAHAVMWILGLSVLLWACLWFASRALAQTTTRTATISFAKPTLYVDGTPIAAPTSISYNVYQGPKSACTLTGGVLNAGCSKSKVGTITSTSTTISSGLQPGETCWQVSVVANGLESALSNEGCKTFAWPATETVTITVT